MFKKLSRSIILIAMGFVFFVIAGDLFFAQNKNSNKKSAANLIREIIYRSGINEAGQKFQEIKQDRQNYSFIEREFNLLGYQLINRGEILKSVEAFKMNVELFPGSANVYDSLGEAYLYLGKKDKAVSSYKKIAEINPENKTGQKIIDNIEAEYIKRQSLKLTKFHRSVMSGKLHSVRLWLKSNPEFLHKKSSDGDSVLHLAVIAGQKEIVNFLISAEIKLNQRNILGQTAYNLTELDKNIISRETSYNPKLKRNLEEIRKILTINHAVLEAQKFPVLTTKYLGQKEPGLKPEIFARGIVSNHRPAYANITFAPDFKEACWTLNTRIQNYGGMIFTSLKNGRWSAPFEMRFMDREYNHRSPFFSLDGKRLFFQTYLRGVKGFDQQEKFYYIQRTGKGWSKPKLLDPVFNKYGTHWQFSLDKKNNLYFSGKLRNKENTGGIYFSEYKNGKYAEPVLIIKHQKSKRLAIAPAISPEGDFLVFTGVLPRGVPGPRIFSLYVSFRKSGDQWSVPVDIGDKLKMGASQPRITPDGKYLFFINKDVYWVDKKILNCLK